MKNKVIYCDICQKEIDEREEGHLRMKIKESKGNFYNNYFFDYRKKRIDICRACKNSITRLVLSKRKELYPDDE